MSDIYKVKLNKFEGPLDLLLDLIEKRKLHISEVSLAKVTDDFIEHVKQFDNLPMGESAHFILIASTLLLIKSKSLLPELALSEEEQGDIKNLETRLKIYKRIKAASVHVAELFGKDTIFAPAESRKLSPVFTPAPEFTLEQALITLRDLIKRLPKPEKLPTHIVQKVVSLEDMIGTLTTRITSHLRMGFKEFTKEHKGDRVNIIVSFLAMLELVKNGVLHVSQENSFGEIMMETKDVSVPHY